MALLKNLGRQGTSLPVSNRLGSIEEKEAREGEADAATSNLELCHENVGQAVGVA